MIEKLPYWNPWNLQVLTVPSHGPRLINFPLPETNSQYAPEKSMFGSDDFPYRMSCFQVPTASFSEFLFSPSDPIGNPPVKKYAANWFTNLSRGHSFASRLVFSVTFSTWVGHHFEPPFGRMFFGTFSEHLHQNSSLRVVLCGTPICRQPTVVSYAMKHPIFVEAFDLLDCWQRIIRYL